jgi:hypothetical protein
MTSLNDNSFKKFHRCSLQGCEFDYSSNTYRIQVKECSRIKREKIYRKNKPIPVSKTISNELLKFELTNGRVPAMKLQLKRLTFASNEHLFYFLLFNINFTVLVWGRLVAGGHEVM